MGIYNESGAFNAAVNDTTGVGRYSASGALRIKLVSGSSYVGLYAADGAMNVVDVSGVNISTYGGLYHPSGALRGRSAPTTLSGLQAPDGSYYFSGLFSPLNLFINGEQGVWYDPSDFSTMFQDSAGTTPVTAVEQPVGLILDKSKRLALGSELVSPINFTTGWTSSGGTVTFNSASNYTASGVANVYQAFFTVGKRYTITINSTFTSAGLILYNGTSAVNLINQTTITSGSTYTYSFLALATQLNIRPTSAGTVTVNSITVKEVTGNHAYQSTPASRPVLRQEAGGQYYLAFDGTDDSLATASITPGADKAQVFAGIRKTSDAALAIVAELSATIASNAGSFALTAPNSAAANYNFSSKGTTQTNNTVTTYTSPLTSVLSGVADIAGASNLIRVNGVQVGSVLTTQGTGNYLAYPIYIGRRGGTSNPFTGRIYSLILRFSAANLSDAQIASTETWVNGKTGAY